MKFSDKIGHYVQYAFGVNDVLREPVPEDPEGLVRDQMENREARWLDVVKKGVFDSPANPYTRMFEMAGCSYEDLERGVRSDGLEPTLRKLYEAGVYLTHDEFKGKTPIRRSGCEIPGGTKDFLNPLVSGGMYGSSSGSRSGGVRTQKTPRYWRQATAYKELQARELELANRVGAAVRPILPAGTGIGHSLRSARVGRPLEKWFSCGGEMADSFHYRALTSFLIGCARMRGCPATFPTHLPPNDFSLPAEWLAARRREGRACYVTAFVSPAVRVAAAALDLGLDIDGTLFIVGGEALTAAKRRTIESARCEVAVGYYISEVGQIGLGCRQTEGNCVHLFEDGIEVITRQREAPLSGTTVSSLMFTNLLPYAPYLFINAEMDDAGILEPATCDCSFSRLGFKRRIRDILSYGKLTGHGVTLMGTQVVEILEKVLPAQFGGGPTDYQLVEREGRGQTQLVLRVSPGVPVDSLDKVRRAFLSELPKSYGGSLAARLWSHSDGLEVMSAEPFATRTGKVLSLHLLGTTPGEEESAAS